MSDYMAFWTFAQAEVPTDGGGGGIIGLLYLIFCLAVPIAFLAGVWKTFSKAGQPGWAAIIPIYQLFVAAQVAGRPLWWGILLMIPLVNIIVGIIVSLDIANKFGKGAGFGIGLILLPVIFFPILGFGDAQYQGSAA